MPATPKSKSQKSASETVLIWNRGISDPNGSYRVGVVTLNYQVKDAGEGQSSRVSPVTFPITPGLCEVPREHWERSVTDAERVAEKTHHRLATMIDEGRLSVVDLGKMRKGEAHEALDQTASKALIKRIAEGRVESNYADYAAELIRTWRKEDRSHVRKVTAHFGSFLRAG